MWAKAKRHCSAEAQPVARQPFWHIDLERMFYLTKFTLKAIQISTLMNLRGNLVEIIKICDIDS